MSRPEAQNTIRSEHMVERPGVKRPPTTNPYSKPSRPLPLPTLAELALRLSQGDMTALARAITLVESGHPKMRALAGELLDITLPLAGKAKRIGITGVPGVGKSTLIEALGRHLIEDRGLNLAVLAIDPTSSTTHGSILGDKSRMPWLGTHPKAYVRPSPSSGSLGGVAHQTREAMQLCEAAGFQVIFIETVGVGQSEIAVHSMVDCFLLLMLAGAGDELQGIKRGVMEMADILAITKVDGENEVRAKVARQQTENALHMIAQPASGWQPSVKLCSAKTKQGIPELWDEVESFLTLVESSGWLKERRAIQAGKWMKDLVDRALLEAFYSDPEVSQKKNDLAEWVRAGAMTPRKAAEQLLEFGRKEL
jgi:LAO/AO transport system kinase